jgi:MarR family transcriptional regulator, transcriptional regulator for hemolysin
MLRTYADQRARQFGTTKAQWFVLSRIQHSEGINQSDLAELCDLQPISLSRLIDKLCEGGLIERRSDPHDRRVKRLYLLPAAEPMLKELLQVGRDMMEVVLAGVDSAARDKLLGELHAMKTNLQNAIANRANDAALAADESILEPNHG